VSTTPRGTNHRPHQDGSAEDGRRVIGNRLSTHANSLNFLRLAMAAGIVWTHSAALGLFRGASGVWNGTSFASTGLYGLFGISGFLIAHSVQQNRSAAYLWRRTLRLFPALILCLLVTAFVLGPIAWLHGVHPGRSLVSYFNAPDSPYLYVLKNALVANPYWTQHTIAGTPHTALSNWNLSIWTLFYEFLLYLVMLVFCVVGILRRRLIALLIALATWGAMIVITLVPTLSNEFNVFHWGNLESMLRFSAIFLTGAICYLFKDQIPDNGYLAGGCFLLFALGWALPTMGRLPAFSFTPIDIFSPFVVYAVLWLGIHLPFKGVGNKNDYSYGIYIYGMPTTIILVLFGAPKLGVGIYMTLCMLIVIPFALMSWWLVEKRSMALKRLVPNRPRKPLEGATSPPGELVGSKD